MTSHFPNRSCISPEPLDEDPAEGEQGALREALEEADDPELEDYCWILAQAPPEEIQRQEHPRSFGDLRRLIVREIQLHPLTKLGLAEATQQQRRQILQMLQNDETLDAWGPENGILEAMARLRRDRRWKWSTLLRYLCAISGELKMHGVKLDNEKWNMAVRGVAIKTREERPRQAVPATAELIHQVVTTTLDKTIAANIAMSWITSARTGCIAQLAKNDVVLLPTGTISVTFRRGKTVRTRGPYTVHSKVPPQWMNIVQERLREAQPFKTSTRAVLRALRAVDRHLETRSLRRGALQALASAGVSEEDLLHFSGHTTVKMLRRYLEWGRINAERAGRQAAHAHILHPNQDL